MLSYMFANKWIVGLFLVYTLFSFHSIYSSLNSYHSPDSPRVFVKDPNATSRITAAITSDHDMAVIARSLHNKVLVSWQVFYTSIYRSVDIPFLFSLTERSSLYDNPGKIQMLPFYELPFFFLSLVFFIKWWDKMKKYGYLLLGMFFISLVLSGFIWPFIFPLKLVPLMITIQLFIFLGSVGFITEVLLWRRK